jgi:hypothetical protein
VSLPCQAKTMKLGPGDLRSFSRSGFFIRTSCYSRRTGYVAILIHKIKIAVFPFYRALMQDLRITLTCLRLPAHIAFTVDEVQVVLIITLEMELVHFLSHDPLDSAQTPPAACK